jgi:single-stranded-DNA-specific exonuclease
MGYNRASIRIPWIPSPAGRRNYTGPGRMPLPKTPAKTWRLLAHDYATVERLASSLRLPPLVAQMLLNRGVDRPEQARRFLDAPLTGLHPPESLPGVEDAADRILAAVRAGKKICVYGDYDVDGISGSAILLRGLSLLNAEVDLYVPHRLEEGYGLNCEALRKIADEGAALVVTVDCGIASLVEAEQARRLGLELIITDHHEFKEQLPGAEVLVHPRLPNTDYPFGWLSGAAVAFKLAWALAQKACGSTRVTPRFRDFLLDAVALASLGVVADVVPLHDENRILVRHGLSRIRQAPLPGLKALCEIAGLMPGNGVRASDVAFKIAPRINAAGRLGRARLAVDLLTTGQPEKAADLARYLEEQNFQRQNLERQMVQEAHQLIEAEGRAGDPALVLARRGWHPGVIGIVASRMAETYARPALLIALPIKEDPAGRPPLGQGSARSVPGFALHEALAACGDLLEAHGGHHAAAGFRIRQGNLQAFRDRFCDYTVSKRPNGPGSSLLVLDAETPLSALTLGLVRDLDRLEPFGADNRKPLFLAGDLRVVGDPRRVGAAERHLSFRVRQHASILKAFAFGMGDRLSELMSAGGACCLAFTPKLNEWHGWRSVDLEVSDFQPGPRAHLG